MWRRRKRCTEVARTPSAVLYTDQALSEQEARWLKYRWITLYGNGKPNDWPPPNLDDWQHA